MFNKQTCTKVYYHFVWETKNKQPLITAEKSPLVGGFEVAQPVRARGMRLLLAILIILAISSITPISAEIKTESATLFETPDFFEFFSDLPANDQSKNTSCHPSLPATAAGDGRELVSGSSPISKKDFDDYLNKYYPRVFVIRDQLFSQMTSDQVAQNLQEIVDIFSEKPWFYFQNKPKDFDITRYWEFVLDQLAYFAEFVEQAEIDLKTNIVIFDDDYSFGYSSWLPRSKRRKSHKDLKEYWQEQGIKVHQHFYALSFDYLIKLFNEGILLKDWTQASYYHYELKEVFERLIGTIYEAEYQEHLRTCSELVDLLKQHLGLDRNSGDSYMDEVAEFYD